MTAGVLAPGLCAWAQGAEADPEQIACRQRFDPVAVTVEPLVIRPGIDVSVDTRTLTTLEGKTGNQRVLGRTVTRLRNATTFRMRQEKLPSGRICLTPAVEVKLSYEPTTIYIGSEYPPGTCAYAKIMEHEQRHLAMYQFHLSELAPLLQQDLRVAFSAMNFVFLAQPNQALPFPGNVQGMIRSRIAAMADEARARQLAVDSAEELGRLSDLRKLCATAPRPSAAP